MQETIFFFFILFLLIAGYYSLVVMPKQRAFKKHQRFIAKMQVGEEVISSGGIIGQLVGMDDLTGLARVRIAEGVEIRIITAAIRPFDAEEIARSARLALEEKPS